MDHKTIDAPGVKNLSPNARSEKPNKDKAGGKSPFHQKRPQEVPVRNEETERARYHRFGM